MKSLSYSESNNPLLANEEKWDDDEEDEEEQEEEEQQRRGRRVSDEEDTGELNTIGIRGLEPVPHLSIPSSLSTPLHPSLAE